MVATLNPFAPSEKQTEMQKLAQKVNDPSENLSRDTPEEVRTGINQAVATEWKMRGDAAIYRGALLTLAVVAVVTLAGALILSWYQRPIPESVIALGAAAIGAIVGLMAPSPS